MSDTKKTFFYGWVILVACMIIQAIPYGIAANIQPQFVNYVVKGEGFTLGQFSLLFTISTIATAVASPFIGKILSNPKTPFKIVYIIGAILSGGGFLAFSYARGIWMFYVIAVVVQIGTAIISAIGVPLLVNSWFTGNKGLAMGLAYSGGGIGNIFLQKLSATLLATRGYRYSYFIFGIVALCVSIPLALFFLRMPKSKAELVVNTSKKHKEEKKEVAHWGYSFKEVQKLKGFWILAIGFIFVGLYIAAMAIQFMGYFYSLGLSASYVGTTGAIFAFFSIFGNLFGGVLFDKFGITKALILGGILTTICGISLLLLPSSTIWGYVYVVCFGISVFAYMIGPSYLAGALFGNREYGTILGIVQIFFAIGFAAGSSGFGLIVDAFNGSYMPGWIIATVLAILAYILLVIACASIIKKNEEDNVVETKKL